MELQVGSIRLRLATCVTTCVAALAGCASGGTPPAGSAPTPAVPGRPARERAVSFVELRSGDTIAWGDPVDGLAVGIGRVQAFLGRQSDLVIAAYLENRGSEDLSGIILSTASFVVQIDDGFYAERDYGGMSGPMRPGKRDGPVLIDTEGLRAIENLEAYERIDDAAPCVALSTGPHTVAVHCKLNPTAGGRSQFALAPSKHVEVTVPARSGDNDEAVAALTEMLESRAVGSPELALRKLGKVPGEKAETAIILSLKHREEGVRCAAATALAGRRSKAAVDALIAALEDGYEWCRRNSAESLGKCGDRRAVGPLRRRLEDPHMETRYSAVVSLVELGEPFDAAWAVPIIRSREGNAFGNAIWLVRRHAGPEAATTLAGCLDMSNASADSYYNYTLVWQIADCGGPRLKYHHDFDSGGTPEQVEANRRTLSALGAWLEGRPGR